MKSRKLRLITKAICLVAFAIPVHLTAQHTHYTVTDLGTLGGTFSFAGGINNRGDIEGFSTLPGDTAVRAFLWQKGLMADLGTLGGPNSFASWRLNERGEVGGQAETSTPDPLGEDFCGFGTHLICPPSIWQKGVPTPLPTLGGNNGFATGVNSRGQVVGDAENSTPDPTCPAPQVLHLKPVVWEKGRVQELPLPIGDSQGIALTINDRGQIAGISGSCITSFHALLWQNGTVTDLGSLGGTENIIASDMNNQGQVTGLSNLTGDAAFHAFLWQNGVMTDLGTLPGDVSSTGDGINSKGQVVGGSIDVDGNERAVTWANGVITDLNTLIPADSPLFLIEATGTNNSRGQIAGFALETSSGEIHAFLLTPSNSEFASDSATLAARGETNPKVVLPANVRKMLRESRAKPYLRGGFGGRSLK
jgi:probable HAF family extracellular repeat protein